MQAESAHIPFSDEDAYGLEAALIARSHLYALFHKLFGGTPTRELLDALLDARTADAVDELAAHDESMQGLLRFLADAAAGDREALLDAARDEHTRTFVGPGVLPAPVCESPYLTRDLATFQENTLAVRRLYASCSLRAVRYERVPEDHVSMMCRFMAIQAGRAFELLKSGQLDGMAASLRLQADFVQGHLLTWLDAFAADLRRASRTAHLYPQLVEALAAFARVDATLLAEGAFWAENVDAPRGWMPQPPAQVEAAFEQAVAATEALAALRLVGLEDCELTAL